VNKETSDNQHVRGSRDCNEQRADERLALILEYENSRADKKATLGCVFRSSVFIDEFCQDKNISPRTFYRWLGMYHREGMNGLKSHYLTRGNRLYHCRGAIIAAEIVIDIHNPLRCLDKIRRIIESCPAISLEAKAVSRKVLSGTVEALKRKRNLKLSSGLTADEVVKLKAYRAGNHKKYSSKATAILMANESSSMTDVLLATGKPIRTIYRWLSDFNKSRLRSIETKVVNAQKEELKAVRKVRVIDIIHNQPCAFGINRTSWTYDTIVQAYGSIYSDHLSRDMVQRLVKATGCTWRKARVLWTSPDLLYREKLAKVVDTVRGLKEGEAFFFVDEAGPYRVMKRGGRSLVSRGTIPMVPYRQTSRGKVQFAAALEAMTNQVVWVFGRSKQASIIVDLIKKLTAQYAGFTKLYLTWDAISTHGSKAVKAWVKHHNTKAVAPFIEIVPLPTSAQFLNIIEGVLSGAKRAVIDNSNYNSAAEMEAAVAAHFQARNEYFLENPRRAGNKIWDQQAFNLEELEGGIHK